MSTSARDTAWPTYLRWLFGAMAVALALTCAFNIAVDPLGVFGSPLVPGLSARKPYLDHHRELARWARARRACAQVAILGNSRAEIGFDPTHPSFAMKGLTSFNHAIPGTGLSTSARQLGWLMSVRCAPSVVIVGVDFFDFLGGSQGATSPSSGETKAPGVDSTFMGEAVLSLTGIRDSLQTLAIQRAAYPSEITERGFNPLLNYEPEVKLSGHYALFRQRAEENARRWRSRPLRLDTVSGDASVDELALTRILESARQSGAETHLVIYPYHAQIRVMIDKLGLGGLFDQWKRRLVAAAFSRVSRGERVAVWDFSLIGDLTSERIPVRGDTKTRLNWYWEAGHFKKALGDRVLTRILGGPDTGFGAKLDEGNVESMLAMDRNALSRLKAEDADLVAEVDRVLVATAR